MMGGPHAGCQWVRWGCPVPGTAYSPRRREAGVSGKTMRWATCSSATSAAPATRPPPMRYSVPRPTAGAGAAGEAGGADEGADRSRPGRERLAGGAQILLVLAIEVAHGAGGTRHAMGGHTRG